MAKFKSIDDLKNNAEITNIQYYFLDNEAFSKLNNKIDDSIIDIGDSQESEDSINQKKQDYNTEIFKYLKDYYKGDSYPEKLPVSERVVVSFTYNEKIYIHALVTSEKKTIYEIYNEDLSVLNLKKNNEPTKPATLPSSTKDLSSKKIESSPIAISSTSESSSIPTSITKNSTSSAKSPIPFKKEDDKKLSEQVFVNLTEENINAFFIFLKAPTLKLDFKDSPEEINSRTSIVHNELCSKYESKNIFNKVTTIKENGNIEKCAIQNNVGELGMVIQFKHAKNQASQIDIPQSENKSFSGIMSIARLDNDGKELKKYDILRIKEGKVIDIFCADPKPTLENSRVAEIYEQLNKEPALSYKPTKSYMSGISASSSEKNTGRG